MSKGHHKWNGVRIPKKADIDKYFDKKGIKYPKRRGSCIKKVIKTKGRKNAKQIQD